MSLVIIHVRIGRTRTSISMERVLADLLSLHTCGRIETAAVTKWCQRQIAKDPGAFASGASQRLASLAVLEIAPKALQDAYWDNQLKAPMAKILARRPRQKSRTTPTPDRRR